ncbi:DUF2076 domain-containing protein [Methylopila sp. Yamaguchi]|uniref:DUF2076 domain-containing protein n=1 Tax=Methylopila sp. Yamaguchi TaxID=1437817 RepID=UPI000CAA8AE7|nr:DUF2076 domain-containing protein [Methylopila sp. Yamaguchi]GBD49530.1 hypothetical protein METY_2743 [Methylopila sp. Yamaguchi]
MNAEERKLIADLFDRVRSAETAYRDPEAEAFIAEQVARQPHAPYAMAQTIVMQNQGLEAAQRRIEALERELEAAQPEPERAAPSPWGPRAAAATGGGLFGGLFGGGDRARESEPLNYGQRPAYDRQPYAQPGYGRDPYAQPGLGQQAQPSRGGGFLSGALQTAAGVAGGALLFSGIQSMFGGHEAQAAAAEPAKIAETPTSDATADDHASNADGGGWFSGMTGADDAGAGDDFSDDDWA